MSVGEGTRLDLFDIAGTVAYHGRGRPAAWHVRIELADGAELRYRGEPFVVADGADVQRTLRVELADTAGLRLRETLILGRSGEFGGRLRSETRLRIDGARRLGRRSTSRSGRRPTAPGDARRSSGAGLDDHGRDGGRRGTDRRRRYALVRGRAASSATSGTDLAVLAGARVVAARGLTTPRMVTCQIVMAAITEPTRLPAALAGRRDEARGQHVVALGGRAGRSRRAARPAARDSPPPASAMIGLLDLGDDRGLDALGRLVEDEQPRLGDQGAGDRQLLALAAGEQAGPAGCEQSRSAGNRSSSSSIERLAARAAVGDELQVLQRGELRERLLTLRHVRHAARDALVRGERRDVLAVEQRRVPFAA